MVQGTWEEVMWSNEPERGDRKRVMRHDIRL